MGCLQLFTRANLTGGFLPAVICTFSSRFTHLFFLLKVRNCFQPPIDKIVHSWFSTPTYCLHWNAIFKLSLFWCAEQFCYHNTQELVKRRKNHKPTNNVMSNDGSSIEMIDWFHGDWAVLTHCFFLLPHSLETSQPALSWKAYKMQSNDSCWQQRKNSRDFLLLLGI